MLQIKGRRFRLVTKVFIQKAPLPPWAIYVPLVRLPYYPYPQVDPYVPERPYIGDPYFAGYPCSHYITCEKHSGGETATTYTVLLKLLQFPLFTSKRATMQPSAYDAPSQYLSHRGVLAKPTQVQHHVWATFTQV